MDTDFPKDRIEQVMTYLPKEIVTTDILANNCIKIQKDLAQVLVNQDYLLAKDLATQLREKANIIYSHVKQHISDSANLYYSALYLEKELEDRISGGVIVANIGSAQQAQPTSPVKKNLHYTTRKLLDNSRKMAIIDHSRTCLRSENEQTPQGCYYYQEGDLCGKHSDASKCPRRKI